MLVGSLSKLGFATQASPVVPFAFRFGVLYLLLVRFLIIGACYLVCSSNLDLEHSISLTFLKLICGLKLFVVTNFIWV